MTQPRSEETAMTMTLRLVDGSQPEDWNPRHGDRPCTVLDHDGHSLNGCPNLWAGFYEDEEEDPA